MFGDKNGVALGQFYHDITKKWNWDKADATADRGTKAFRTGDMAMTINGTWYFGVLQEQDYDWGMAKPFVAPGQTQKTTWANSHTLGVPNSTQKKEAAVKAAEWLTQNSLTWGTDAGHLPAAKSVLKSDELRSATVWNKTLSTFSEMAQDGQLSYMPSTKNNENYKRPVNQAIAQIYSGQVSPEKGIKQAADKVTKKLQG